MPRVYSPPPRYKVFNGKRYTLAGTDNDGHSAAAAAKRLRREGYRARVISFRAKVYGGRYVGDKFAVYRRRG